MDLKVTFDKSFTELNYQEKLSYLKKALRKNNLNSLINELLKINEDDNEAIKLIIELSKSKIYLNKIKLKKNELISIINILIEQNKTKSLYTYLNTLPKTTLKQLFNYENKKNTAFSKTKIYKKLLKDLNNKQLNSKKVLTYDDQTKSKPKSKNILKKEIKNKKVKWSIGSLIIIFSFVASYILIGYIYAIILFYNNHIPPNIYLNNKLIENKSNEELIEYLEELDNKLTKKVKFENENASYEFSYEEIGIKVNTSKLENDIIKSYQDLNGFLKLKRIFSFKDYSYKVEYTIDSSKYQLFLNNLTSKVNLIKKEEQFSIINNQIVYSKGINGYKITDDNLQNKILTSLNDNNLTIPLTGKIDKVNNKLETINKKVGTYTTYYNETQGRAKNIRNAVSKLNETIIYPNETFSFYKTVGPYNSSQGYIFYDKDVGSGVCQVSTTIYNVVLPLNLKLVSRSNHGDMVYYVDYGLDATVYGKSVDFKFKNNTNYPIYIEAKANNGALTVSFWSNENIIPQGYTYKPRVERISVLGFRTYLDEYYLEKYQGTTYLNTSYYSKGK